MSHVKSGGAVSQTKNMVGKRLGVKKYAGNLVKNGTIIVRQRGSVYQPGLNTKMARDFSIYSLIDGYVSFRRMSGNKRGKYFIDVLKDKKEDIKSKTIPVKKVDEKIVKDKTVKVTPKKVIKPKASKKTKTTKVKSSKK